MRATNIALFALIVVTLAAFGCEQQKPEESKQTEPAKQAEKGTPQKAQPDAPAPAEQPDTPSQPDSPAEPDSPVDQAGTDTPEEPVVKEGAPTAEQPTNEQPAPEAEETVEEAQAAAESDDRVAAKAEKMAFRAREESAKKMVANQALMNTIGSTGTKGDFSLVGSADYAGGGLASGIGGGAGGMVGRGGVGLGILPGSMQPAEPKEVPGTEDYAKVDENAFKEAIAEPLSTFSIDVDTAAYTNARRFINQMHRLPPQDSVRIEEFINYFTYDYPSPEGETPFSVTTEVSVCPWNTDNRLVLVGIQGKKPPRENLPPSNLVFLIDSSGSMRSQYKMPLLKKGFEMLVKQLGEKDRVAIVVYAGSAGLVLPSTPGTDQHRILRALDKLRAGGSTAGAAGIQLAYQVAQENFIEGGNNRVILATDGDFNVGASSNSELERMIEEKRDAGVFLTVLGFGMGNYKDSRMETLADKGNGNYGYIDNILEAKKVFVTQMTGTLFTIAKDVKIQIEFNPTKVKSYRLVGYENRMLKKEDFADDKKDAGELGAGHTVTALYEIVPAADVGDKPAEELRYVKTEVKDGDATRSELLTVKLRYKKPDGDKSTLIESPLLDQGIALDKTSNNFRFASSVAMFGMLLRQSKLSGATTYGKVLEMARAARGDDAFGYRAEFIQLVEKAQLYAPSQD